MDVTQIAVLTILAGFAGFVDAVVGGGGLIQIPALFTSFPNTAPATLFGTNKIASICGTTLATLSYSRRILLPWAMLRWALLSTALFAFIGARVVSLIPKETMRPLVLVLLIIVMMTTFMRKDFGHHLTPRYSGSKEILLGMVIGAALGFYDGVFGPGMGTLLLFCFVRFFGYDFLLASAVSKVINWGSNCAALAYFIPAGHVIWPVALLMAVANIAGALIGTQTALQKGAGFVRVLFLLVLSILIAKLAFEII
ncbi:MAG: TSUP family transporter [Nitrospira sp.]|nr:TSUP family transporter [Nitrospira sp.]